MKKTLLLVVLLSVSLCAQTSKPTPTPDCGPVVNELLDATAIKLGNSQKIPIAIVFEDLGPATLSFQIALREALNAYSNRLDIVNRIDNPALAIYVTGGKVEHERDVQGYNIEISSNSYVFVYRGGKTKLVFAKTVFASIGGAFTGSVEYKSRLIKEGAYTILGEFLNKLDKN